MIIAIDGPAGAGKSTLAKAIAQRCEFLHIDSGAMYRAVALAALEQGIALNDAESLTALCRRVQLELDGRSVRLGGRDVTTAIRTPEVAQGASMVSAISGVREAMTSLQRRFAERGDVVMDGRDIGTEVFPHAELKLYLDASGDERARRRLHDIEALGRHDSIEHVKQDMDDRDKRDRERKVAPLRMAADAILLDTTGVGIDELVERVGVMIAERRVKRKEVAR